MRFAKLKIDADRIKSAVFDGSVLVGVAMLSFGVWLAWRPGGFIVGGLALAGLGMLLGRNLEASRRRG